MAPATRATDSLALTVPGGIQVWFTASRPSTDDAGHSCLERALEIRRGGRRIPIPLLYTGAAPLPVNDSIIKARLWLHCQPGNSYLVDLRTGFPKRVLP